VAEFLTSNGISYYLEKIIREAREELYILFPYLQMSRELFELLKETSDRGVPVIIVYANEDLHLDEKLKLGGLGSLEIYQSENLNAKCCCSEKSVILTSMDIHQFTAFETLEMGVAFTRSGDNDIYKKTYGEIKSVITSSKNMNLHKRPVEELIQPSVKVKKIYHGFCIICAMPVSYNIEKPFCRNCASKHGVNGEASDKAGFCHRCGTPFKVGINKPLCETCVNENAF